jgi:hypothetical protein
MEKLIAYMYETFSSYEEKLELSARLDKLKKYYSGSPRDLVDAQYVFGIPDVLIYFNKQPTDIFGTQHDFDGIWKKLYSLFKRKLAIKIYFLIIEQNKIKNSFVFPELDDFYEFFDLLCRFVCLVPHKFEVRICGKIIEKLSFSGTFLHGITDLEEKRTNMDPEDTCSICWDSYTTDAPQFFLIRCGHTFHKRCLETHHKTNPFQNIRCPLCRRIYQTDFTLHLNLL